MFKWIIWFILMIVGSLIGAFLCHYLPLEIRYICDIGFGLMYGFVLTTIFIYL